MLKKFMTFAAVALIWPSSLMAGNFQVINVDSENWPEVKLTAIVTELNSHEATDYTIEKSDGKVVPAYKMEGPMGDLPVNTVVAVDTSYSLSQNYLEATKDALGTYADMLDPKERAALLMFNDDVWLSTNFSLDRMAFKADLEKLKLGGKKTEMYRSLLNGVELLKDTPLGLRHLLVFSDGHDEGSGVSKEEVIEAARKNNVKIFTIGVPGTPNTSGSRYLPILKDLAAQTGGQYTEIAASDADEIVSGSTASLREKQRLISEFRQRLYNFYFMMPGDAPSVATGYKMEYRAADEMQASLFTMPAVERADKPEFKELVSTEPAAEVSAVEESTIAAGVSAASKSAMKPAAAEAKASVKKQSPFWWLIPLLLLGLGAWWWIKNKRKSLFLDDDDKEKPLSLFMADSKEEHLLDKQVTTLGSHPDSHIVLPEDEAKAQHAEIHMEDGGCCIQCVGEEREVKVNGVAIASKTLLNCGDEIMIGKTRAFLERKGNKKSVNC